MKYIAIAALPFYVAFNYIFVALSFIGENIIQLSWLGVLVLFSIIDIILGRKTEIILLQIAFTAIIVRSLVNASNYKVITIMPTRPLEEIFFGIGIIMISWALAATMILGIAKGRKRSGQHQA